MTKIVPLILLYFTLLLPQNLPNEWSQSYCTYDIATAYSAGEYSLGFAIDNYAIYSGNNDTIAYDERRFDILAKLGVLKNTEIEIKYSYPTGGVVSGKYQFLDKYIDAAFKLGFGYMKGTRSGFITDYVFDFYPTFIFSKKISKHVKIFFAPKIIYSIHTKDRQEHSDRKPRYIFQYGHGIGILVGSGFSILPEGNWLFGDNMGVKYTVNQFGLGVNLKIH